MKFTNEIVDFSKLSKAAIAEKLRELKLGLTVDEALKIQNVILKRPPSLAECVLWSIQGSEHCSYKSSRQYLKKLHTSGPHVILGPSEDAGIVEVARDKKGKKYGLVISHESHNHPSQIVPYEGAATGVGGNVRDVCCMGAKVIASADPLRFGDLKNKKTGGISSGVVSGIAGYGNPIGVPIIAGDVYFDESYDDNCLVNVVTLGVLCEDEIIHSRAPKNSDGYDLILVGKPTDNSGFGGASFASFEMNEQDKEKNKGAVQEPNAFLKRHLLKSTYGLFKILKEKKLLDKVGFKDLGAGGVACASVELADSAGMGATVDLDKVHVGMENLNPAVILCSETQERFMWVAHPSVTPLIVKHYNTTFDLPHVSAGAKASVIGKIRKDGRYVVTYRDGEIVNAKASAVTQGLLYDRPFVVNKKNLKEPTASSCPELFAALEFRAVHLSKVDVAASTHLAKVGHVAAQATTREDVRIKKELNQIFLKILSHENVACRVPIYEQYDKQVQGITVIEAGRADAGVMQPFKDDQYPAEIRKTGVALSVDHNPRYNKIDAYWGTVNAVGESVRNVAAVGAVPWALTDCLCFGNPEIPESMGEFTESVRGLVDACRDMHVKGYKNAAIPIVSGNVSLYNETKAKAITPSAIISCAGHLQDVTKAITMSFKKTDSLIFLIGERKNELGGSVLYDLFGELGKNVPKPVMKEVEKQVFALTDAIDAGLVLACHDISDGGIATTLAEMSFESEIGCAVELKGKLPEWVKLFSETGGFVLEVEPIHELAIQKICKKRNVSISIIGKTTKDKTIRINSIEVNLQKAKKAWMEGLRSKLW